MPEEESLNIVRSLRWVDLAVLSDDEDHTVCKTLSRLHPDIFTKLVDNLGEKIQSSSWLLAKQKLITFSLP